MHVNRIRVIYINSYRQSDKVDSPAYSQDRTFEKRYDVA